MFYSRAFMFSFVYLKFLKPFVQTLSNPFHHPFGWIFQIALQKFKKHGIFFVLKLQAEIHPLRERLVHHHL
jgi:hypothetical protein